MHRIASAPASSANLGPGFDTLAVALGLYIEVELEERAEGLLVEAEGQGSELPRGSSHLAAAVASQVLGHDRLWVRARSEIPVARGLGSSAALAVAAAAAAGAGTAAYGVEAAADGVEAAAPGADVGKQGAFRWGLQVDGHPENAAASTFGGLVAAAVVDGEPVSRSLQLDPALSFVVVVPDFRLTTSEAREVLPALVPRNDAVFNLSRLALLIAGLADHTQLVQGAGDDRLHQDARSVLFPASRQLLSGLREAGALTSCWSGAGPSLLAICTKAQSRVVANAARGLMSELSIAGEAFELPPDLQGVQVRELE